MIDTVILDWLVGQRVQAKTEKEIKMHTEAFRTNKVPDNYVTLEKEESTELGPSLHIATHVQIVLPQGLVVAVALFLFVMSISLLFMVRDLADVVNYLSILASPLK